MPNLTKETEREEGILEKHHGVLRSSLEEENKCYHKDQRPKWLGSVVDDPQIYSDRKVLKKRTEDEPSSLNVTLSDPCVSLVEFKKAKSMKGFTHKDEQIFIDGLLRKAEMLYRKNEYEQAMVLYSRGLCIRPRMEAFQIGLHKSKEAIITAFEKKTCVQLGYEVVYVQNFSDERVEASGEEHFSSTKKTGSDVVEMKHQLSCKSSSPFVEEDLFMPKALKMVTPQNEDIKETVYDINTFLNERKNVWKLQNLLYSKFRDRMARDRTTSEMEAKERENLKRRILDERNDTKSVLKEMLETLAHLHEGRNCLQVLRLGNQIVQLLNSKRNRVLPNKLQYYVIVYNLLAHTCIDKGRLNLAKKYSEQLVDVALLTGQEKHICRAYGTIGKMHASAGKYCSAIKCWVRLIPLVQDKYQLAWLFHEIGRCYFELKKIESARIYARWSYESAKSISNNFWELNSLILIAQAELHLGDSEAAMEAFKMAKNMATDSVTWEYIQKSIELIKTSTDVSPHLRLGLKFRRCIQVKVSGSSLIHGIANRKTFQQKDDYNEEADGDISNSNSNNSSFTTIGLPSSKSDDNGEKCKLLEEEIKKFNQNYHMNPKKGEKYKRMRKNRIGSNERTSVPLPMNLVYRKKRKEISLIDMSNINEVNSSEFQARKSLSLDNVQKMKIISNEIKSDKSLSKGEHQNTESPFSADSQNLKESGPVIAKEVNQIKEVIENSIDTNIHLTDFDGTKAGRTDKKNCAQKRKLVSTKANSIIRVNPLGMQRRRTCSLTNIQGSGTTNIFANKKGKSGTQINIGRPNKNYVSLTGTQGKKHERGGVYPYTQNSKTCNCDDVRKLEANTSDIKRICDVHDIRNVKDVEAVSQNGTDMLGTQYKKGIEKGTTLSKNENDKINNCNNQGINKERKSNHVFDTVRDGRNARSCETKVERGKLNVSPYATNSQNKKNMIIKCKEKTREIWKTDRFVEIQEEKITRASTTDPMKSQTILNSQGDIGYSKSYVEKNHGSKSHETKVSPYFSNIKSKKSLCALKQHKRYVGSSSPSKIHQEQGPI